MYKIYSWLSLRGRIYIKQLPKQQNTNTKKRGIYFVPKGRNVPVTSSTHMHKEDLNTEETAIIL